MVVPEQNANEFSIYFKSKSGTKSGTIQFDSVRKPTAKNAFSAAWNTHLID